MKEEDFEGEEPVQIRKVPIPTPKAVQELVPGTMLGRNLERIIVVCVTCKKPLYVLYPNDLDKPALPLGDFKAPEQCDEPCPICGQQFAKFNDKLNCAQYLTNLGWV